jgi:hypothetical protein
MNTFAFRRARKHDIRHAMRIRKRRERRATDDRQPEREPGRKIKQMFKVVNALVREREWAAPFERA